MFARSTFRSLRPIQNGMMRSFASESTGGGSGRNYAVWSAGVAAAAAGLYIYGDKIFPKPGPTKPAEGAFKGGDQGFLSLKLENVETVSHNTKKLRFALPDPDMVSGLMVTSAVVTKHKPADKDEPVIRPYTPVSDTDMKGHVDFVIKRYEGGPMSSHMHTLTPGQTLDIKGPIPKYPITENKHDHIAMIAGGTGITPMWQVMRAIFKNPNDKTKVTLVFGNVTEDDILLKKELQELENTYPRRFKAFYVLNKPPEGWTQGSGFINKDLLKTVLPEPKEENIKIFVCGPPGLYNAMSGMKKSPTDQGEFTGALKEMGYTQDQVFKF